MINGKGIYIWYLNRGDGNGCIAGNLRLLVWLLKVNGFGHILIKVADGSVPLPGDFTTLVQLCRQEGIQVFGWQYIYTGSNSEADVAIRLSFEYGLDGFIVNAERQFDRVGMDDEARSYMCRLRSALGDDFPIGLSSYRYPSVHAEFPWRAFLEKCDLVMPQVYWMQDETPNAPLYNLAATFREHKQMFAALGFERPLVFTGASFSEHGWVATPEQVKVFLNAVSTMARSDDLVVDACNTWEMWEALTENPELWPVIAQYPWRYTPMSTFDEWAKSITDSLRSQGFQIPNPPATQVEPPGTFQVRFDGSVNLRKTPGGADIGDVKGVVTVSELTQQALYGGRWYTWAQVIEPAQWKDGWVAIDNGTRL
jgi:hypothetical protein